MGGIVRRELEKAKQRSKQRFLRHAGAEIAERIEEPLLTCEAVLAEAAFHLVSASLVLSFISDDMLRVAFNVSENLEHLAALARRYQDRRPDLADLCLVRMSELYPRHVILTVDEMDFRVYRRNKRDVIPLLSPPGRPD